MHALIDIICRLGERRWRVPRDYRLQNYGLRPLLLTLAITVSSFALSYEEVRILENTDTLTLYNGEKRVGSLTDQTLVNQELRRIVSRRELIVLARQTREQPVLKLIEQRQYNFDGMLEWAVQEIISPSGSNSWELKKNDAAWELRARIGGRETVTYIENVNETILASYQIRRGIFESSIKPGDSWGDTALEMTSGQLVSERISCKEAPGAQNLHRWVFVRRSSIDNRDERWEVDTLGRTWLAGVRPFVARRPDGISSVQGKQGSSSDIFEVFSIPVSVAAQKDERIRIILDSGAVLDSSVQHLYVKSGTGWVLKRTASTCAGLSRKSIAPDSLRTAFLRPTAIMQSDDKRIRKLAQSICKDSSGVCESIKSCNDNVYRTIAKRNTATFSSAVETLEAGFGDCGEHAVLLAALLRACGIPARIVLGLVYIQSKKAYLYHAWVMAYSQGWIFADPALGVFPASTGRIPLLIDDEGKKLINLAAFVDRVKISYVRD